MDPQLTNELISSGPLGVLIVGMYFLQRGALQDMRRKLDRIEDDLIADLRKSISKHGERLSSLEATLGGRRRSDEST